MLVGALFAAVTLCEAAQPSPTDMRAMEAQLVQQGLGAFIASASSNGWQAPMMPSEWYLDHGCPQEQKPTAREARNLGLALLTAIDAWAPLMRADRGDKLLAKARDLVNLAYCCED